MSNSTQPQTVTEFLEIVDDEQRRNDSRELIKIMQAATRQAPMMWGSIIGFGTYHYKYESGREGDTMTVGFSPRRNSLVLYGIIDDARNLDRAEKLGKVRLGKGCIYINKLTDVDTQLLARMIADAYKFRSTINN